MSTSNDVIQALNDARASTAQIQALLNDLIVEHTFQDVATLSLAAAAELLQTTQHFMEQQDEPAIDSLERVDELLDELYAIIEGDLDESEE